MPVELDGRLIFPLKCMVYRILFKVPLPHDLCLSLGDTDTNVSHMWVYFRLIACEPSKYSSGLHPSCNHVPTPASSSVLSFSAECGLVRHMDSH